MDGTPILGKIVLVQAEKLLEHIHGSQEETNHEFMSHVNDYIDGKDSDTG